jgi:phage shock protein PspC (stress-responsive transcriptional regulator)
MEKLVEKLIDKPKIVSGVCHYFAKQFGWSVMWVRVISALILLANPVVTLIAYLVLSLLLDKKSTHY